MIYHDLFLGDRRLVTIECHNSMVTTADICMANAMENERSSYNELCVVHVTASSLWIEWQRAHDLQQSSTQELFWNCDCAAAGIQ